MRSIDTGSLALALAAALALAPLARAEDAPKTAPRPHEGVKVPPLRPFSMPKIKEATLENGIRVFLVEDKELPLVDVRGILRAGEAWDPADKVGLASVAADVLRTGGSEKHPADALDKLLESRGASIEVSAGYDQVSVSLSVLREDQDLGLELLQELLVSPRLPQDKIDQARREKLSEIERRNDEGPQIADRLFPMAVFGKESPLAREPVRAGLEAIKREDVLAWHKGHVHPKSLIVGAFGDFDADAFLKKLASTLGAWRPGERSVSGDAEPRATDFPSVDVARGSSWTVVQKEDVNQSAVVLGHAGGVRSPRDPDYAALVVMNEILGGGGFTSRLMRKVRSDEGLAYDVHSTLGLEYDHVGTFELVCQTKSGSTVKAIRSLLREMELMTKEEPTDEELTVAKDTLENMLPLQLDTTAKVVDRTLAYAYRRFPLDYLERFRQDVAKVTKADVLRVARAHLHPGALRAVVVGNPAQFDEPLEAVAGKGNVEVALDPETWAHGAAPAAPAAAPSPARAEGEDAGAKGKEILERALEAMGGKKALAALESLRADVVLTQNGPAGKQKIAITQTIHFPDKIRLDVETPMGAAVQAYDGKTAWFQQGDHVERLPASVAKQLKTQLADEDLVVLRAAARGELEPRFEGETDALGRPALKLKLVRKGGEPIQLLVDPKTSTVIGKIQGTGAASTRLAFLKHEALEGGVIFPRRVEGRPLDAPADTEPTVVIVVKKAQANVKVDDASFSPPAEKPGDKKEKKDEAPPKPPKQEDDQDEGD